MLELLGLAIIYAWGHASYIVFKKVTGLTTYEKVISITAFVSVILYVLGTLME